MRANQNQQPNFSRNRNRTTSSPPAVHVARGGAELIVVYNCSETAGVFDICHETGRILQTGNLNSGETRIDISFLEAGIYILLILDGDIIRTHPFEIAQG